MARYLILFLLIASHSVITIQQIFNDGDRQFVTKWKGPYLRSPLPGEDDDVEYLTSPSGHEYMCLYNPDKFKLGFDSSATNSSEQHGDSPVDLLKPLMKGNYCSYKFELFWIYELCHGRFLRQYHEENAKYKAKVTQEYYLGRSKPDDLDESDLTRHGEYQKGEKKLVNGVRQPYVKFNMTDDEARIELHSIKEISTCEYEAIVLTPHLCKHEDFTKAETVIETHCYSLNEAPRKPPGLIDIEEEEEQLSKDGRARDKGRAAYIQGRTLIIDADLLLS